MEVGALIAMNTVVWGHWFSNKVSAGQSGGISYLGMGVKA